jgi:DNA-binding XRE family transcriptional regulator
MPPQTVPFEVLKEKALQDAEVRAAYEALEPAFQLACLRIERGLTQQQLAERAGTKQPNIARFESGKNDPRLSFLRRLGHALGYEVQVQFVPLAEKREPPHEKAK